MRVATYGTLRYGEGNWSHLLRHCEYVGEFRVSGFEMYSNGAYPYAAEGDGEITVDVFEIDDETLARLDMLEGYPVHYDRKEIVVDDELTWIYVGAREWVSNLPKVAGGDWKADRKRAMLSVRF
jgi:gamma-glutamylcyclotransferase (GGCT)/AIG2-like uncharacterized protein YtfP